MTASHEEMVLVWRALWERDPELACARMVSACRHAFTLGLTAGVLVVGFAWWVLG